MEDKTPITEDILINLGFVKESMDDGDYYYALEFNDGGYCDLAFISDGDTHSRVDLFPYTETYSYKYMEDIQNIYKSITGKEL